MPEGEWEMHGFVSLLQGRRHVPASNTPPGHWSRRYHLSREDQRPLGRDYREGLYGEDDEEEQEFGEENLFPGKLVGKRKHGCLSRNGEWTLETQVQRLHGETDGGCSSDTSGSFRGGYYPLA
ncbi:hypothetical protein BEWA_027380 [Theileria equi strain WA]|uniref:Uncharacterized protein n=1 Tax=Theileria equi strain WA TaxID=1537102 RepID=L0AYD6_THEEQ|nr:hypothetical protein BEWA_027380 [Theileria equi strain WA]AFZ79889.1 hypothetical protein BEWA_027380 [Theileria equi strain WA]|eukprot:XP_004829555.1 hypothetical protein BEWA_027380 [Theileria equi strain WA]